MKRAFTLIEALVVVAILALIAAFMWPCVNGSPSIGYRFACQSNLKQIGLGFLQYVQDYDERLPPARVTSSLGWADVLQPYLKSTQIFQCPAAPNTSSQFSTDYFYNRRLARVTMDKVTITALTVMGGDGEDDAPTWNSWGRLPADAATNDSAPSQRHLGRANYLFADGHVKTLNPTGISSTFAAPTSGSTFAIH